MADLGEDRLAVWMEDIDDSDAPWSHATHAHAAELLARLAARRTPDRPAGACSFSPGFAVRKLVETRGGLLAGIVADDSLWARPLVADVVDHRYRADLQRLGERLPAILEEMDTLPSALPHGDAAPVNLLRPAAEPDTFVAIDWGFGCQLPLGFDLGQLLTGEVVRGRMDPAELPALLEELLAAYVHGLHEEGLDTSREVVFRGLVTALATRNGLDAYPFDTTEGPATPEHLEFLRRRAALGRFVFDLVLEAA